MLDWRDGRWQLYVPTHLQAGETQTTALPANAANATLILGASNNVAIRRWRRFNTGKTPVLIRKDVTLGITYR